MIANQDSTSETMLRALATSVGALQVAARLDIDRSEADRSFFAAEQTTLQGHFDRVFEADTAVTRHQLLVSLPKQAAVIVGDAVLDRGVRQAKTRMKLELKNTAQPEGADAVFPSDISELVDAEREKEPQLVLQAVARFDRVPEFPGKDAMRADLQARAERQQETFKERSAGTLELARLQATLDGAVAAASTALYQLEKRLLERFPRDVKYVRAFFLDVTPPRKKKNGGNDGNDTPPDTGGPKPGTDNP